jgi:hypothetical protein
MTTSRVVTNEASKNAFSFTSQQLRARPHHRQWG